MNADDDADLDAALRGVLEAFDELSSGANTPDYVGSPLGPMRKDFVGGEGENFGGFDLDLAVADALDGPGSGFGDMLRDAERALSEQPSDLVPPQVSEVDQIEALLEESFLGLWTDPTTTPRGGTFSDSSSSLSSLGGAAGFNAASTGAVGTAAAAGPGSGGNPPLSASSLSAQRGNSDADDDSSFFAEAQRKATLTRQSSLTNALAALVEPDIPSRPVDNAVSPGLSDALAALARPDTAAAAPPVIIPVIAAPPSLSASLQAPAKVPPPLPAKPATSSSSSSSSATTTAVTAPPTAAANAAGAPLVPLVARQQGAVDPATSVFKNAAALEAEGFTVEAVASPQGAPIPSPVALCEADRDVPVFASQINSRAHTNFLTTAGAPAIVSLEKVSPGEGAAVAKKALVRTVRGEFLRIVEPGDLLAEGGPGFKDDAAVLAKLQADFGPALQIANATFNVISRPEDHAKAVQTLIAYENKVTRILRYKFGVLYVRPGQDDEDEWFANNEPHERFYRFLDLLAEKTPLLGHTGYTGGLNVRQEGVTGTHSYYTTHRGLEFMFHVSPLLPYLPLDTQQVERKRHHGNDVVMIIYHDALNPVDGKPADAYKFDPKLLRSHFNHIFVVVEPVVGDETSYRISVCTKPGVSNFRPILGTDVYSTATHDIKDVVLTKCVNGERTAMHMGEFEALWTKTREVTLQSLIETFLENSTSLQKTRAQAAAKRLQDVKKQSGHLARAAGQKTKAAVRMQKRGSMIDTTTEFRRIAIGAGPFPVRVAASHALTATVDPPGGFLRVEEAEEEGDSGGGGGGGGGSLSSSSGAFTASPMMGSSPAPKTEEKRSLSAGRLHEFQATSAASRSSLRSTCGACGKSMLGVTKAALRASKCAHCELRVHAKCAGALAFTKCAGIAGAAEEGNHSVVRERVFNVTALQPGNASVVFGAAEGDKVVKTVMFQIIGTSLDFAGGGDSADGSQQDYDERPASEPPARPVGIGGARLLAAQQQQQQQQQQRSSNTP
jgi:Rap/ran-GAP